MNAAGTRRSRPVRREGEAGYTLLAVMFLLCLLTLSLSIALPRMAREIQRDRERETVQRGLQYRRAIQLYYRKFHAYPPNVDALVKTQEIRFLRKKYVDLSTGKAEWKPILFGQAKTPTLGFFGEPLAGSSSSGGSSVMAGTGPSGGNTDSTGATSLFGSTTSTTSSASATASPTGTAGSAFGSSGSSGVGSSSSSSGSGQTFGGAGIIGFSPMSSRQSILIYKKKNHYNEWEFVYDPLSDQKVITSGNGLNGNSLTPSTSQTTQPQQASQQTTQQTAQ
jgi:type II secretory pathway pseudopilin PulG